MKAIAYSIKPFEKEFLAIANRKKHEITLISNALDIETAMFADGKDAAIVFTGDDLSAPVIEKLADLGIRYIVTRSLDTDHIDKTAAARFGIKLANIPSHPPLHVTLTSDILQETASQTIRNLDLWQMNKCVGKACVCAGGCKAVVLDLEAAK
ncbi:lactate dehydrogenase [Mucilaginibacter celer]|uniref:Lactate dehydrogenase n=1 Tax=Mucilaginibacter celer TaxID=2305508 RepID=A0A494VZZ4_9SPHI|nr:lactate dehydrogenase [Mucilaginibacter celer]AYL96745.1 lactate dehydrogenase [Mucilaginibacter celer]